MAEYNPAYCQKVKDWGKKGKSWVSFSGSIDVTMRQMLAWAEQHEEFNEALEISQSLHLGYWEEYSLDAIDEGNAQALGMAKFQIDQSFSIYEKMYKKKVQSISPSDMNQKRINYGESSADRDVVEDMRNGIN